MFDNLDVVGMLASTWDLLIGKKEPEKEKEDNFYLKEVNPIKFNYRPKFLNEYIGQERAKDLICINLEKIAKIKFVHFLISGTKGCGKSTLANVIVNEIGFEITWHIAGDFTKQALIDFLMKNEESTIPQALFVDEIHNLNKQLAEYMYTILEDFILPEAGNPRLKPFIFIGATTDKNLLVKRFAPLVDRCGCDIVLEQYEAKDMKEILKQYNEKVFKLDIPEEIYDILSKNTRFTPRIALSFFDDYVVTKDINRVLTAHRVIKDSLTTTDIKILQHLGEMNKPVGVEALAMIAGITREDYTYILEPFLIFNNYLTRRARGREITNKGKELLQTIKEEK